MVLVLKLTIGILLASFVVVVVYAAIVGYIARSKELAVYQSRCRKRDTKHATKPIDAILAEDWGGPTIDLAEFKQIWASLASHLGIDPHRMRPSDRVSDIMVTTAHHGPDSYDLLEFIQDFLPHADPCEVLEDIAHDERETVGDLIRGVLLRRVNSSGCADPGRSDMSDTDVGRSR